ncbi:DUF5825 family protein [Streptomyces tsukubensis]|uniref:Uncharacterized protein n=1 Tax=Streptomyces tsukubensis TaxID=83656 RepID=A0A1V4AGL7_9ACTN|nr:DUF5825 family protein [Streptomyces tsukubensis]OON82837.1 hypothetical protein B1H18_02045 [Streptomyces tsukubensis]QFR91989.1 hypothetical protein GBW32_01650 [Streptomyces tsukubensis]
MDTLLTTFEEPLRVRAWRDYDPEVCALPGMDLGDRTLTGQVAGESGRLWEMGARRVVLPEVVELGGVQDFAAAARAVRALSLVRDLTARAVLVEWKLAYSALAPEDWRVLSHLQPPEELTGFEGAPEALADWRNGHYLGKCLWRQGPGFIQIRDRRWGDLRRFTADEPHYQVAIEALAYGAPAAGLPPAVLTEFGEEHLIIAVGELAWWLPYRVDRWTQEAMAI